MEAREYLDGNYDEMLRLAESICLHYGCPQLAPDILHNIALALLRAGRSLDNPRHYMAKAIRNKALTASRRRRMLELRDDHPDEAPDIGMLVDLKAAIRLVSKQGPGLMRWASTGDGSRYIRQKARTIAYSHMEVDYAGAEMLGRGETGMALGCLGEVLHGPTGEGACGETGACGGVITQREAA